MKSRTKKICSKCNREISVSNFQKHFNSCKGLNLELRKITVRSDGSRECPYCQKIYSNFGIGGHIWLVHQNGKNIINSGYKKGTRKSWNKGLTKETNESVKRIADKHRGVPSKNKGRSHTLDSRKRMSESAKLSFAKGIHATWKTRKFLQSYPEKYTESILISMGITNFSKEFRIKIGDSNTCYFLDFYFPNKKIDLEIDGGTHRFEEIKAKDKSRDEYLSSLGITVVRIPWKNKESFNERLRDFIKIAGVA